MARSNYSYQKRQKEIAKKKKKEAKRLKRETKRDDQNQDDTPTSASGDTPDVPIGAA